MNTTHSKRDFIKKSILLSVGAPFLFNACGRNQKVRFGVVTDSHYADREASNTRYYRESLDKMHACMEVMNQEQLDFIVHLGDFKDEDLEKKEADTLQYLKDIEAVFTQFKGSIYHCIGNHDIDSITKTQFLKNITNTGISKDQSYYSFDTKGFHFIILDANFDENYEDQFYKKGANWQDTRIPPRQLQWLKKDLQNTNLPTIIFCHHPLFEYFREDAKYHINNYEEVQNILEESTKVLAVFQGHVHEEKFIQENGIHYITQLGMVDFSGLEQNSFAIVEIDNQQIQIDGYKRATDQFLPIGSK